MQCLGGVHLSSSLIVINGMNISLIFLSFPPGYLCVNQLFVTLTKLTDSQTAKAFFFLRVLMVKSLEIIYSRIGSLKQDTP